MKALLEKVYAPKKNLGVQCLAASLYGLSLGYRSAIALRNTLYQKKVLKSYRSSIPVISIGNIVAGGVGKTPLTLKIGEMLIQEGYKLAILSRGYKSPFEKREKPTLLSQGSGPLYPSSQCGDEPYLISQRLKNALMLIGKNRVESARLAESFGADVILLDDAMQHRRLHRNLEIVLLDAKDPFGKNHLLPRGLLREPKSALKRADLIVLNHIDDPKEAELITQVIRKYSQVPILLSKNEPKGFYSLNNEPVSLDPKTTVAAFCGLAKPHHFYSTLKNLGLNIALEKSLRDHEKISDADLEAFATRAKESGATAILCTEKDAVKLNQTRKYLLPIYQLKIELKIIKGKEHLKKKIMGLLQSKDPKIVKLKF